MPNSKFELELAGKILWLYAIGTNFGAVLPSGAKEM